MTKHNLDSTYKSSLNKDYAIKNLEIVFVFECNENLKLLKETKNQKINYTLKKLTRLHNESFVLLYKSVDKSTLNQIHQRLRFKKSSEPLKNEELIVSIITKVELLKGIAETFKNLEHHSVIKIRNRINTLHKELLKVTEIINMTSNITKSLTNS